ncbi:MAG TPA: DUF2255 family protein [Myxococcota bacterium]|jgi:hypothetical protein
MKRSRSLALVLLLGLVPLASLADVDWNAHKAADTVVIVNADEDGAPRETTIWLCVLEGQGYVRGGSGQWVANTLRSGDVKLRVDGSELALHATQLTDASEIERVTAAFREKYGFSDVLATVIRGKPTIFRLAPR